MDSMLASESELCTDEAVDCLSIDGVTALFNVTCCVAFGEAGSVIFSTDD